MTAAELDILTGKIGLKWIPGQGIGPVLAGTLPYIFGFGGFALGFFIVAAGYQLMTSKGDQRVVAAAKSKITYGLTGFIILFAAYWIVQLVGRALGITIINTIFTR